MMMEIESKVWVVETKDKRILFSDEVEAINKWKELSASEPKFNEFDFKEEGVEYKQVSWEKIAMILARGELQ